jgi:hypothetical protein
VVSDPDDIEARAWVEHRRPPIADIDEELWFAEDPETECAGVGAVEAEAVGNLVAVVVEYETDADPGPPRMKLPGDTIARPSKGAAGPTDAVLDRLRSLF